MAKTFTAFGQEWEYPLDLDPENYHLYEEEVRLKVEWERIDKVLKFPDGKTLKLPNVYYRKTLAKYPPEVQKQCMKRVEIVYDHLAKMMTVKRALSRTKPTLQVHSPNKYSAEIIELLGRDYSLQEVHKIYLKKFRKMEFTELVEFAEHNKDKIKAVRDRWRAEYNDISISAKRKRLENLNYLLDDLLSVYEVASTPSKVYLSKEIRGVLDQARKEVEGDEIKLTVSGRIDVEATITHYMTDDKTLQDLTIQQLVISRVAARLGLSSRFLIDRLAHSFYAKFNGFRRNSDLTTKIIYPSAVNYDILDLESKNLTYQDKMKKLAEEVPFQEVRPEAKVNKDILMSKIKEMLKDKPKQELEEVKLRDIK